VATAKTDEERTQRTLARCTAVRRSLNARGIKMERLLLPTNGGYLGNAKVDAVWVRPR
jgi:hypothetical protein